MMWYSYQHDHTQKNQSICSCCAMGLSADPGHVSVVAMDWIHEEIVPEDWAISGRNPPRGPYVPD